VTIEPRKRNASTWFLIGAGWKYSSCTLGCKSFTLPPKPATPSETSMDLPWVGNVGLSTVLMVYEGINSLVMMPRRLFGPETPLKLVELNSSVAACVKGWMVELSQR